MPTEKKFSAIKLFVISSLYYYTIIYTALSTLKVQWNLYVIEKRDHKINGFCAITYCLYKTTAIYNTLWHWILLFLINIYIKKKTRMWNNYEIKISSLYSFVLIFFFAAGYKKKTIRYFDKKWCYKACI